IRPVTRITWIAAARAAAIASRVRGRRTMSSAISVRSRSHASAPTSRGKSLGSLTAGALDDEGGDVGDLLRRQLALERRHDSAAVRDPRGGRFVRRLELVEVRPDGPG